MFIYLLEDGSLLFSRDQPTELDLENVVQGTLTLIRTDSPLPQEYTPDGIWEDIQEAKLRYEGEDVYHDDPYNEYEDEEENE